MFDEIPARIGQADAVATVQYPAAIDSDCNENIEGEESIHSHCPICVGLALYLVVRRPEAAGPARDLPQLARLYLPITRCALLHSLRDSVNVLAGLYCFTVQLCAFTFTRRLIST